MVSLIRKLLFRAPAPALEHPVFGRLTLHQGKIGPYWMTDASGDEDLAVSIETVRSEPPTEAQVAFYQALVADWDQTFLRVAPLLVQRYEDFLRRKFPPVWSVALKPAGIGVPLDGDELKPWDVAFECVTDNLGYLMTCYFEGGKLVGVSVDT